MVADPRLIEQLVLMRFENGASPLLHRTVLEYIESGAYEPHVDMLRGLYRARRDASAEALAEHCEPYLSFRKPAGGFFHWLRLHEGLDSAAVTRAAAERGVAVTAGQNYYHGGGGGGIVYGWSTRRCRRSACARRSRYSARRWRTLAGAPELLRDRYTPLRC